MSDLRRITPSYVLLSEVTTLRFSRQVRSDRLRLGLSRCQKGLRMLCSGQKPKRLLALRRRAVDVFPFSFRRLDFMVANPTNVAILGSTGSIGRNALDVVAASKGSLNVV